MSTMVRKLVQTWVVAMGLLGLLAPQVAWAHPLPETRVWIDAVPQGIRLTLDIPVNRLALAHRPLLDTPLAQWLPTQHAALSAYLLKHVQASGPQGPWAVHVLNLHLLGADETAELQAELQLEAPAGADPRQVLLRYDVVTHEVRTHQAQFFLRHDWAAGRVALGEGLPQPLAVADAAHTEFRLVLGEPHPGLAWWSVMKAGALHIAEGADHLLFLWMLLLVTPLRALAGTWSQARPMRDALAQAAGVVTMFTVGHSLTLVLGSMGWLQAPVAWVEALVAASIVVAAAHAARPLFAQAERAMALGFGLVHGLAFSASLSGAGLTPLQHAQALLAFNLGIEAFQLMVVALGLPVLLVWAQRQARSYALLRRVLAAVGAGMATFWLWQRIS